MQRQQGEEQKAAAKPFSRRPDRHKQSKQGQIVVLNDFTPSAMQICLQHTIRTKKPGQQKIMVSYTYNNSHLIAGHSLSITSLLSGLIFPLLHTTLLFRPIHLQPMQQPTDWDLQKQLQNNAQVDCENSTLFVVRVIEKYFYEVEYTHEVGCVLAQVSNLDNAHGIVGQIVGGFPQVMKTRSVKIDGQLKDRKQYILNYAMKSVSLHMGHVYSQLRNFSLTSSPNDKWAQLITKLFSSLLFQYLPPQLIPCLLQLYLTASPLNNLYQIIHPYSNFIKLLVSLFHYCHYMKKPKNIQEYHLLCSSPYMDLVEWPIVISNANGFDLAIPQKNIKGQNKQYLKNFNDMIKEAQILQ